MNIWERRNLAYFDRRQRLLAEERQRQQQQQQQGGDVSVSGEESTTTDSNEEEGATSRCASRIISAVVFSAERSARAADCPTDRLHMCSR